MPDGQVLGSGGRRSVVRNVNSMESFCCLTGSVWGKMGQSDGED